MTGFIIKVIYMKRGWFFIMKKTNIGIWIVRFLFCICVIVAYKTLDNVDEIFGFFGALFSTLTPFVIGGVIAFFLYPVCKKTELLLRKTKRDFINCHIRGLATLLVIFATVLVLAGVLTVIVPMLYNSIFGFISSLPIYLNDLQACLIGMFGDAVWIDQTIEAIRSHMSFDNLASVLSSVDLSLYASGITQVLMGLFNTLIGFIISIYLLLDRASLKRAFIRVSRLSLKERYTHRIELLASQIASVIYNFIFGQALDALFIAVVIGVLLTLFSIPNSILLACIYFLFALIPYFGSTIGVIGITVLSLLFGGVEQCLVAGITALALQQLDSNLINPRIVGHAVGIRPLYVILGITLFGGLFGPVGLFLGPPMMAILLELLEALVQSKEQKLKIKDKSLLTQLKESLGDSEKGDLENFFDELKSDINETTL